MTGESDRLRQLAPFIARARAFRGWDLSAIEMRSLDGERPWDHEGLAHELAAAARRVLDVGTGGGEVYARVTDGIAARFVACEEWVVNAGVAGRRLKPLGIDVVRCETGDRRLPFAEGAFELVLARHEAIEPAEVDRVLTSGGTFLTQQVVPDAWPELRRFFPRAEVFADHWREYPQAFRAMGYEVEAERFDYRVAFAALGDLVMMLMVAPWQVPGFEAEADIEALITLERELGTEHGIVLRDGRYLLRARKRA